MFIDTAIKVGEFSLHHSVSAGHVDGPSELSTHGRAGNEVITASERNPFPFNKLVAIRYAYLFF